MTTEFQYREVSNLLDAVKQLMTHFERYTSIPKIAAIKRRVDVIQTTLKRHVHASFREIGQVALSTSSFTIHGLIVCAPCVPSDCGERC